MGGNMPHFRINQFISHSGLCSRREADRLILEKRVTVNGNIASMGMIVDDSCEVLVDGKPLKKKETIDRIILAVYKPKGVVCTTARFKNEQNIIDMVGYPERLFHVGRLDKQSEGLILLTNRGEIVNYILKSRNAHEKEYVVTIKENVTKELLSGLSNGVPILETVTKPCRCIKTGRKEFHMILTQGLNRQIRRMCEYFGYHVEKLVRIRIMNITLDGLKPGENRRISPDEEKILLKGLNDAEQL